MVGGAWGADRQLASLRGHWWHCRCLHALNISSRKREWTELMQYSACPARFYGTGITTPRAVDMTPLAKSVAVTSV